MIQMVFQMTLGRGLNFYRWPEPGISRPVIPTQKELEEQEERIKLLIGRFLVSTMQIAHRVRR